MIYADIKPEERASFELELKKTKDGEWLRRLIIINFSDQMVTVPELSKQFKRSQSTIRDYIHRYNSGGLEGLRRKYSPGAPQKFPLNKEEVEELLRQSPSRFEKLETKSRNWTNGLLVLYCKEYHGVIITQTCVLERLKAYKISLNRGKLKVTSPDPLYTVIRDELENLKKKAENDELTTHDIGVPELLKLPPMKVKLAFTDSTDLHGCPDIGYSYVPTGEQLIIDTPGKDSSWYALFGTVAYPSGDGIYTIHKRKRHQEVEAHLKVLFDKEPDTFWMPVMDNASQHKTEMLDKFWQENKYRIKPFFLPTYSPHLNLIEKLWWFMRKEITRNQFYGTLKGLAETVVEWFENLPIQRFCSLMGIKLI